MNKIHERTAVFSCTLRPCKNEKCVVSYRHKEGIKNFQRKEREAKTMVSPNDSEN